jgi:ABC-type protease/lipase transport system fused ATPase/permease subunit
LEVISFDKTQFLFYLFITMSLTLNQFLLLVITIAVVVAVTFLINLMRQLRKTAHEAEETLVEVKKLVGEARETSRSVQAKIEDVGELVQASKKTAVSISEIAWFVTTKILRPSSKYWPFLFPLIRLGWRQAKKFKEEKNV